MASHKTNKSRDSGLKTEDNPSVTTAIRQIKQSFKEIKEMQEENKSLDMFAAISPTEKSLVTNKNMETQNQT
jgi:hypothetical protein